MLSCARLQPPSAPPRFPGAAQGALAGLVAFAVVALALLPSRLAVAMRVRGGDPFERLTRAAAGAALDFDAVVALTAAVLALAAAAALLLPRARLAAWQHLGPTLFAAPWSALLYLVTVAQQEVKAERGAFSTAHEVLSAARESSFVGGSFGFLRYTRIWLPAALCLGCAGLAVAWAWRRRPREPAPLRGWAVGLAAVLVAAQVLSPTLVAAAGALSPRLHAAALGAPLQSLLETSWDVLRGRAPGRPAELLLQLTPTPDAVTTGAARLGWPARARAEATPTPCPPHPHARPLDPSAEPSARGAPVLSSLQAVSRALFHDDSGPVAVFVFSLESFRADDVHALNSAAPRGLHPFVNALFERAPREGVLSSRRFFQAGVRSAQGVAAVTCGLGTLPYNLSLIRDLDGVPLRCATDVLFDAGFAGAFFYGSDASYDGMAAFFRGHGVARVVSHAELPEDLPKGAWGGLTDLVVFDEAVKQTAAGIAAAPRFAFVMSLSNHSPYPPPEDLPAAVTARVDEALKTGVHRASADDRRRLLTHSYTDAALERFFARLDETGLAERALVVLQADHSTGEDYVWGPDSVEHETDEAKARLPFLVVLPRAHLARAKDGATLAQALDAAQAALSGLVLSQNDVPALLLALLSAHPAVARLPTEQRWHTLGGQVTSPWFRPGGEPGAHVVGINGVDELYVLDEAGARVGAYEDVVFLKARGDRERVTPRLVPVAATLVELLRRPSACR